MADRTKINDKLRFEVFRRDGYTCQYCGKSATEAELEIDHVTPVSKGGKNEISNLKTACKSCNAGKKAGNIVYKGDKLKKLLEIVPENDKDELSMVRDGRDATMLAFKNHPGKETKANLDAARELYEETIDRLWQAYFPEEAPAPEGERFKNRIQAHNWLQSQGYKISRGKFYNDCEAGFPAVHKDGSVSRFQVLQYGQQLDVERRSVAPADLAAQREEAETRKAIADAKKAEIQAEDLQREQDAKWLHRDEAWAQLAALIGSLRDTIRHQFHIGSAHIIHLSGGDPTRAPEVYEGMEEILAQAFNDTLAAGRIEGTFEDHQEDAA